ncbi:lytic transglycosylase domain-containing protein [Tessaracoccus sp. Y36]
MINGTHASDSEEHWQEPWWRTWGYRVLSATVCLLVLAALFSGWGLSQLSAAQGRVGQPAYVPQPAPRPQAGAGQQQPEPQPAPLPAAPAVPEPVVAEPVIAEPVVGDEPVQPAQAPRPGGVDPAWADRTAAQTGIPRRALVAYGAATLAAAAEQPECGLAWNTLAGIGWVESQHGFFRSSQLGDNGYPAPPIRGIALNGDGVKAIVDTDGGAWDGDTVWDRAVGPMQFIPSTWAKWGADGNGDGYADPNQIDDAALAAARYLCHSGPMTSAEGWRDAIFSYNRLDSYVRTVAETANAYAERAGAR